MFTVRELFGVVAARGAVSAYVVTSSAFTKEARNLADGRNITLIDGDVLDAMLRIKEGTHWTRHLSSRREKANRAIRRRTPIRSQAAQNAADRWLNCVARKGPNAGQAFWGATRYPKCRGTLAIK